MGTKKTITIIAAVDVIAVLSSESLSGNVYLFDNNKANGSTGEGTSDLKTNIAYNEGDEVNLLWNVIPIEPESYAGLSQVIIDKEYVKAEKKNYEGSDVSYWKGTVVKKIEQLPYHLVIKVGTKDAEFTCELNLVDLA